MVKSVKPLPARQAIEALKKANAFETLLVELSGMLSEADLPNTSIETCLAKFSTFLEVDRSSLMECRENHTQLWVTHSYARPGFPLMPSVMLAKEFPWFVETLRRGENVCLGNIEEAPHTAALDKQNARKMGLKAILMIPLIMEGSITYIVSLASLTSEHLWSNQVVQRLEVLGKILVSGVQRSRHGFSLRERNGLFQEWVEEMNQIFWVMDMKPHTMTYVSPAFEKIFGFPAQDLYRDPQCWMNAVHPEDRQMVEVVCHHWMAGIDQAFDVVYRIVDREGTIKYLHDRRTLFRRSNGEIDHVRGIVDNITDLKRHEQELKEREEYFRIMADTAPVMIWRAGIDKGCVYFNKPWLEFTGRRFEQELGNGWTDNVHPEDLENCQKIYTNTFDARQEFSMTYRLRRHDGIYRWVLDAGTPQYNSEGTFTGYIGSCFDITDIEMAKKALQEVTGRVILAQEQERQRIARELHDDINQQLSLLSVELQLLANGRGDLQIALRDSLAHLQQKIARLSSDLHDLSHQLHPAKLDKLGLLPTVRGYIREMKKMYKFSVELDEEDFPDALPNDLSICLFRIIQEAVWNSRKYSKVNQAFIQLNGKPDYVYLRIYDFGAGFDIDTTQKPPGIGIMGMEERARLCGGTFAISSRSGGGTHIGVVIPLSSAVPQE